MDTQSQKYTYLPWVLTLVGFTSVVTQIVLVRELVVVFQGNEMSLGVILACWLWWTAVGSGMLGRLAVRSRTPRATVAALQTALAFAVPLTVVTVRASGTAFGATTGEVLGPGPMLVTALATLALVCLVSGGLFAAGSRLYMVARDRSAADATGAVYLLEAAGSALGGILASLVLIRFLSSIDIALVLSLLNLASAAALALARPRRRAAAVIALVAAFAVILPLGGRALQSVSLNYLWRGVELVESRNSVYGNLAVVAADESRSVYENGVVAFTAPDRAAAEEAVHYALLQHPAPSRVLMIGGGVSGAVAETLKHPSITHIDYVELDPAVLDLGREYFAADWLGVVDDPRVAVHHTDGRLFLKSAARARRAPDAYDAIIVNLADPRTAQLNRFYTLEFFEEAGEALSPSGVLAVKLTGAENYIGAELADFLSCIHKTLREVFSGVVALPGPMVHFFASGDSGSLTEDPGVLVERLRERGIATQYVRDYYLPFRMSPDRMSELRDAIEPKPDTPLNEDLKPVAYYFNIVLWSTRFNEAFRGSVRTMGDAGFARVALLLAVAAVLYVGASLAASRRRRRPRAGTGGCVAAMGFTMIGLEVLILLAFQSVYGFVYHQLALLIATFMAGMALGSAASLGRRADRDAVVLVAIQAVAAVLPLAIFVAIAASARIVTPAGVFAASNVLFPLMALVSGLLGGYQFPVASRLFFVGASEARSGSGPGAVYAIDLAGACLGALLIGAYFIPVFGFFHTAILLSIVNIAPAIVVAFSIKR